MIRVAVIGAGSFGSEHARVYSHLQNSTRAVVCDINEQRGREIAEQFSAEFVSDYHQIIGQVDAASLTVPTESHAAVACELLESGVSVLVEKPIARTLDEADQIIAASERGK